MDTHSDFSAVGSGCAQNKKNSARPFHFIQAVVVSSLDPKTVKLTAEDTKKQRKHQRVESERYERHIRNESHHFFGHQQAGRIDSGHFLLSKCLREVLRKAVDEMKAAGKTLKWWAILTDGCGGESKNRYFVFEMHLLCKEFNLDYIIIVYAPTSCFKCICDLLGGKMKQSTRQNELDLKISCANAFDVYCGTTHIPQPAAATVGNRPLLKVDKYNYYYTADKRTEEAVVAKAVVDKNILILDKQEQQVNAEIGPGFFSSYAVKVNQENDRCWFKRNACWCDVCLAGDFAECQYTEQFGEWTFKKMKRKPVPEARDSTEDEKLLKFYKAGGKLTKANSVIIAVSAEEDGGIMIFLLRTTPHSAPTDMVRSVAELDRDGPAIELPELMFDIALGEVIVTALALTEFTSPPEPTSAAVVNDAELVAQPLPVSNVRRYYISESSVLHTIPLSKLIAPSMSNPLVTRESFIPFITGTVIIPPDCYTYISPS
jgi:hypothetical protein